MTLLDYGNINYYVSSNQINPFEEQLLKQEPCYYAYDYDYDYDDFPSEAELLCIDPMPPSLFDFDVAPTPPPPPTPPLQLDYHHADFHVDDLIIPGELLTYYPCIDDSAPPLHLTAEDNYPYEEGFSDQSFPFPKKNKLSFPLFNGFVPELHGVSQGGALNKGVAAGDDYFNCQNYIQNNNIGGADEFTGQWAMFSGGWGGGKVKVKEVSAQSRAARERRRKITGKTQELGKLVPGGTKLNTAEMLEAAYKYVKFLQAQLGVLNSIKTLNEGSEEEANLSNLPILGSLLVQEKLYAKEKCLVPMDSLPKLEKHSDCDSNPSISEHMNELLN